MNQQSSAVAQCHQRPPLWRHIQTRRGLRSRGYQCYSLVHRGSHGYSCLSLGRACSVPAGRLMLNASHQPPSARLHRAEASIGSAIRSAANVPRTGASRWSDQTGRSESCVPLIGSSLVYPVPRCHQQEQVYGSQDQRKTGSPLCQPSRNDRAMQPRQRAGMVVAAGLGRDEITVIGRYGGHGPAGSVPDPTFLNVNRPNSSDLHRLTRTWPGSRAQDLPMSSRFFAHRFFDSVLCNACPSAPAPSGSPHSTVQSQTRGSESHLHRPRPKQPK